MQKSQKRPRPCGNCRQRKRRCAVEPGQTVCVLCRLYKESCTFDNQLPERPSKRPRTTGQDTSSETVKRTIDEHSIRTVDVIEDYDALQGPSLLKKNLGLQQHQYSRYNGLSGSWTPLLLDYYEFDDKDGHTFPSGSSIRRVSGNTSFSLNKYIGTQVRSEEIELLDQIERVVMPHGPRLVTLYFRIVHPSFPVLDKKVFLEKYERTHREFSPACLGGVYLSALDWWNYDPVLSNQQKPDVSLLEPYIRSGLHDVMARPKLSTLQGGILLLQHRPFGDDSWALSAQIVATMQELGVHLDCDGWRIPAWEKSLRKRLAWSTYILDKWMALVHGRPSHIVDELDWTVEPLTEEDFPETAADENEEEGSSEIETGRLAFQMFILLSQIVNEILRAFYSARATKNTRNFRNLLQIAKPIQIKLREWRRDLPSSLHPESTKARKKSSTASLYLSYYAAEISLHKAIILGLRGSSCEPSIIRVCREAARERAIISIEFVKNLKPEQIQSFWHFSSGMNLVYIGIFTAVLYLTSQTIEETQFYKSCLKDYRWTLRVMSRAATFFDFAVQRLDMSLLHLDHLSLHDIIRNNRSGNDASSEEDSNSEIYGVSNVTERTHQPVELETRHPDVGIPLPTTVNDTGFEHQRFLDVLDAVEAEILQSDQQISPKETLGPGDRLDFYGRDWNDVCGTEMFPALDSSPS
ncbi:fungal-specific transcription factor domain-containing protein [Aspergillus spectabilis]